MFNYSTTLRMSVAPSRNADLQKLQSSRTHGVTRRHEVQMKARLVYHAATRRPLITKRAVSYVIHRNLQETPSILANYTQTGRLRSPNVASR